jgi:hypothetical protein
MASSTANIRIEPVFVSWKEKEQEQWELANVTAAGVGGKYITMYLPTGVGYYAWFDENSTDTDPTPAGLTAIAVDYGAGASASTIATALQVAIDAVSGFTATVSGTVVTVIRDNDGECTDATIGDAAQITLTKCQDGKDIDLGLLQGDVEVAFEETTLELTAHSSGTTLLADLRQGVNATVSLTLQESDNTLRKAMFTGSAGGAFTPSGGTELFGWGSLKQGLNTIVDAGRLIFHPVAAQSSDYTRDLCFWKAYPKISSITFSGENPEVMAIEFNCYLDSSRPEGINLFSVGNHTQTGITA